MTYWGFVIVRTLVVEYDKVFSLDDYIVKMSLTHLKHLRDVKREDVFLFNSV